MYIDDTRLVAATAMNSPATVREKIRENTRALYRACRAELPIHYPARHAFDHAKHAAYAATLYPMVEHWGLARLRLEPDDMGHTLDDLTGDCFNPDVNDDIPAATLAREKQWFIDRLERDGVWGLIAEWRPVAASIADDADEWRECFSCWGFVGDDWRDSGYDVDAMTLTIEALVNDVFGESGGIADMFSTDELESILLICRDARRLALAA